MVCQTAGQTRFRALKHENGVSSCATIVVRVIACFQPLRECQVRICSWLMEKDFESWIRQCQPNWQFPNAKSLKPPFEAGMQSGFLGLPDFNPPQSDHPHGWVYCLPQLTPGITPDFTLLPKTNLPVNAHEIVSENRGDVNSPPIVAPNGHCPKQFLVFDQSGNKTTMIFGAGIGTPVKQLLRSLDPKPPPAYYDANLNETGKGSSGNGQSEPILTDEFGENRRVDQGGSEMHHEDTEEINALLYSDDDEDGNYSDEETSTGHSPSTMTAFYENRGWFGEDDDDLEEVASSVGPVKRQKLSDGCSSRDCEVRSVTKTASSVSPDMSLGYNDNDAESCCGGGGELPMRNHNVCSLSGNKRSRKEKIRETVSILQSIIPGGKGQKDAVMVLDEAINYLTTLRLKAKSLGLSAF